MKTIVRRPLILWNAAQHGDQPHAATILFRRDNPFAVEIILPLHDPDTVTNDRLRIHPGPRDEFARNDEISVAIPFSRALLIDGVAPHIVDSGYISLTLPLTAAGVEFYTERGPLEAFTDETLRMVPLGGEIAIADAELDRWLAGVTR